MPKQSAARASVAQVVASEVHDFCVRNANEAQAKKYARFFTEGYDAYGLTDKLPDWKPNREKWAGMLRQAGPAALFDCGDLLMATGKYEEASFAVLFATDVPEFDSPESFERIAAWFITPRNGIYAMGIRNWAHTDILCGEVLSRYLRNKTIDIENLVPWLDSTNKFQRRAVPVSFCVPMNSNRTMLDATKRYAPIFRVIERLMRDEERVVQQGVGWLLREAWKRERGQTESFLLRFKDTAPRLIYQYATEKMDKKTKEQFKKGVTSPITSRATRSK